MEKTKAKLNDIHKPSKLEKRVQTFMETILEVEPYTFEFEVPTANYPFSPFQIDPVQFPVGKMSAKQLWKAYGILSAVTEILEDGLNHPKNVVKSNWVI